MTCCTSPVTEAMYHTPVEVSMSFSRPVMPARTRVVFSLPRKPRANLTMIWSPA